MAKQQILGFHANGRERWVMDDGSPIVGVHPFVECAEQERCVIHNPTDHHMHFWPTSIDGSGGLIQRECEHGYKHPDPDSLWYFNNAAMTTHWEGKPPRGLHLCDGCCCPQ